MSCVSHFDLQSLIATRTPASGGPCLGPASTQRGSTNPVPAGALEAARSDLLSAAPPRPARVRGKGLLRAAQVLQAELKFAVGRAPTPPKLRRSVEAVWLRAAREDTSAMGQAPKAKEGSPPSAQREAGVVETLIPARLERLPWGRFHVLVVAALGVTWILDGLEVTLAGSVAGALKLSPALHFSDAEVGAAGSAYLIGAVFGALFFGWLTDRLGRKKLFFITIAVYLIATALTGAGVERADVLPVPLPDGRGHRRGIRRHQFDHPGTDPGAVSRTPRPDDQRQLLGRSRARRAGRRHASQPRPHRPRARLAVRLPHRRGARPRRIRHAHVDPGKPALACHPRPRGRGRGRRRRHREAVRRRRRAAVAGPRERRDPVALANAYAACGSVRRAGQPLSPPDLRRPHADGGAGLLLQRDLLHLCACVDEFLRGRRRRRRLVHPALRRRQFSRSRRAWPAVRHASAGG